MHVTYQSGLFNLIMLPSPSMFRASHRNKDGLRFQSKTLRRWATLSTSFIRSFIHVKPTGSFSRLGKRLITACAFEISQICFFSATHLGMVKNCCYFVGSRWLMPRKNTHISFLFKWGNRDLFLSTRSINFFFSWELKRNVKILTKPGKKKTPPAIIKAQM